MSNAPHHPRLQHHFYSMEQQLEASILGMWVFLVTEVMFFGGLFMAYIVYRTASAIVSELQISTAVFTPPRMTFSSWLLFSQATGYAVRYTM